MVSQSLKRVQMPGRTIAVGDIHGCAAALEAILDVVQPAAGDTLVTLGDYIDRGPNSRRVLEVLLQLARSCHLVPLKGNHELLMLRAIDVPGNMLFWMQSGGLATLASYGGLSEIPPEHIDFVRECVDYYETATHLFVHANYDPQLPLEQQNEYELFWQHLNLLLPPPHCSGKTAIVGHTPQRSGDILDGGHLVCIDTYCFGSGVLTALDVASGQLWQADKHGKLRN
jgi:serine/threonine protein phosphatase 1